ncbi:response regulator transcription factor [Hyphobacterium sp. CCMP332]|nr:response regulator transcription factor [Hyphobacterium sp. CCMP332]
MKKNILIVEKHPMMRLFLHNYLSKYYNVKSFKSFKSIFEEVEIGFFTDAIVSHYCSANSEESRYLEDIKFHILLRNRPVLMFTNEDKSDQRIHALSLGAKDSISKPFNPEELQLRISRLINSENVELVNSKLQVS